MKHLLATVCLLFFSVLGRAQTPMSGSSPVSTFDSISLKVRKELFSLSDSARAMKMYGRWEGFWKDRASYDSGHPGGTFSTISVALAKYIDSGPMACLGSGYEGDWKPLGFL
jgi:hypothetical protein